MKYIARTIAASVVALHASVFACNEGSNSLLILGDSVSAGYMPRNAQNLPFELRSDLSYGAYLGANGYVVTNTSGAGHKSEWARDSQQSWAGVPPASDRSYGNVVIMMGINDAVEGRDAVTTKNIIMQAVDRAFGMTTPFCVPRVLVVSPPYFTAATATIQQNLANELQSAVAAKRAQGYRIAYLDIFTPSKPPEDKHFRGVDYHCSLDGHPCADAHADMGQRIAQAFAVSFSW